MGACIMQEGNYIAYWNCSLTNAKKKMGKELLVVVTCIKEYHSIIYSAVLNRYTDHKKLTFRTLSQ